MAVYKVIQDIESEDKLLGPLTLKGFVYAAVAGLLIFIDVRLLIGGTPALVKLFFTAAFLPPILLFGTLASPLGREQPTEVWLLSHIMFLIKAHSRKWDQSGTKELVRITAPKKLERTLSKNFTQSEVSSRLQALANTLDSRGWAVKNVAINLGSHAGIQDLEEGDERLAGASNTVEAEPVLDIHPSDDILDEQNNPAAQNMQSMILQSEEAKRQAVQQQMEAARAQAALPPGSAVEVAIPGDLAPEEKALLDKIHAENLALKIHPPIIRGGASDTPVTDPQQTVKLELAQSGSDLSVASIARLANRGSGLAAGEVNVPLG